MPRTTRRRALAAIGGGLATAVGASGAASAGGRTLETLVDVPGDPVPENLAIDDAGNCYFGIVGGEVRRVPAERTDATGLSVSDADLVATLPGSVVGVEVGPEGTVWVASQAGDETGVWEVPPGGDPAPLAAVPGFPNDVLYDPRDERLLVTESFGGAVYEVPLVESEPTASVWASDDVLDTASFGANGLTFYGDAVLVAVTQATADGTDVGRLVGYPVAEDGSAGAAEVVLESERVLGADGLTTLGPQVYVAANARNEVVRVTPGDRTTVVADADDGLVFPSDVAFGEDELFVCNFANQRPEAGAIYRLDAPQARQRRGW